MSLGRLLHKGLGVALDAPTLRALSGTAAGTLIASAAGPAYRAIHDHFTLSSNDLATALGDSFSRGLTAIDDELNGWRISRALGSKLHRDYQARIRSDFLDPYAAEHGLDDAKRKTLCRTLNQHSARLIQARERLFPAAELPEPDIAELLASDAGDIGALLIERIDRVTDPLPEDLRGFLIYRDLIGDAVLYFFRETLRRDPRVEITLNALQQAGLRRDGRQLQQQLQALHTQQAQLQKSLTEVLQARDRPRRNALMEQIDRIDDLLADVQAHTQRLDSFQQQFADWSGYLDVRLEDLQQALVGEIRQVGEQVQQGFDALQQRFDALLRHLHDAGLGERIRPEDEFHPPPTRLLREVERTTDVLRQSSRYRARAGILQASVLAAVGDHRQAEQQLGDALLTARTDADKALTHHNLFQLALQRDAKPAALEHLQQAATLDPRYALWRIGKHTPEAILGAGGMGLALLVKNRLDQYRVLKLLWSDDAAAAERFHQEALTMARIAGEHVPAVYDFDHADPVNHQRPYLEMAYLPDALDGESWLQQHGPLSLDQGLQVATQVARVLQLAHRQGIHHHDLKPANLLLQQTDDGLKATVIDFGLSSKVIELHQRLGRGSVSGKSLMARQVFGSLDYAPPEQRGQGNQPGPWSDLYSLAITLYRLLTNAPPNPPNPFLLPDDRDFQQLLFQCLHHDPEQRPTAEQFLERVAGLQTPPPRPSPLVRGREQKSPPYQGGDLEGVSGEGGEACPYLHGWNTEQVQKLQRDTARRLKLTPMFHDRLRDGSAGPEMMIIPAGRFLMGSPKGEGKRKNNERQHEVMIEQPFALGRYPVIFDDYDRFCHATGRDKPEDEGWGRSRQPVINVSWHDAMAYCEWLSEQTGQVYRLPSEAEWEYACRAGTTTPFHFGGTIGTEQANYNGNVTYGKGVKGEYREKTIPVGQFPANAWGLHDMHGNVWEWTGSEYDDGYTGREQGLLAADAADDVRRVFRGGSWVDFPHWVRSAFRFRNHPDNRDGLLGLRLARSL